MSEVTAGFKRRVRDEATEEDAMAKFLRQAEALDALEGSEEYVPVKVRRERDLEKIKLLKGRLSSHNNAADQQADDNNQSNNNNNHDNSDGALLGDDVGHTGGASNGVSSGGYVHSEPLVDYKDRTSALITVAADLKRQQATMDKRELKQQQQLSSELLLLKEASQVQTNALQSNEEIAQGVKFLKPLTTTWSAPRYILAQAESVHQSTRKKWNILTEGEGCPPPIKTFREMKLPEAILEAFVKKGIARPTPIQVQALPALFTGRDMVGIAFTGSGKTLTFSLPMIMFALEEEMNLPLEACEGPIGLILAPSRELARQTFEVVDYFLQALGDYRDKRSANSHRPVYPRMRATLIIGGEDGRHQTETFKARGVHCVVATPGRLNDLLKNGKLNLDICKYLVLDEADRMLDLGFDEEVHSIINFFKRQRQTVLFSATMPQKFQDFAKHTLVQPLVVNVGRAGAANLDVIQEVEYVKQEAKVVYLLECLQKTAPPVVIFCERKGDVDEIHEYLLVKGVQAASIHGGKDQEERNEAIRLYKEGVRDVLVATDIAAKGLDFPDIQHVINFDMPSEIENYIHRIGRTGRCGKTGVATTFINKEVPESVLLDLKHLLIEAKQRVPPVLQALQDPYDEAVMDLNVEGMKGCAFCGGLGHRITDCPKLDKDARRIGAGKKDSLSKSSRGTDW